jgi:acetolactate synthase-1/3 small subunit
LEKIVDVFKVYYNTNDEIIWQQMALYKVPTSVIMKEVKVERLLREFGAKAVVIREDYTVFETTGQDDEINNLLKELDQYGLIEFVRSSRIAIIKSSEGIHKQVLDMEKNDPRKKAINNEFLNHKSIIFQM